MKEGIDFIHHHSINKENIYTLYSILSKQSFSEENRIESIYRTGPVDVIGFYGEVSDRGVDARVLEAWMDELIAFTQSQLSLKSEFTYLMPLILHFMVVYYHPYYDFNGRMARILSYWFSLQCKFITIKFPILSEAINYNQKTKAQYYLAIENSRSEYNDLTFFFLTLLNLGERFINMYHQLYVYQQYAIQNYTQLSDNGLNTLKTILLNFRFDQNFTWEQFHFVSKEHYSKQYNLDLLNALVEKKILSVHKQKKVNYYPCSKIIET